MTAKHAEPAIIGNAVVVETPSLFAKVQSVCASAIKHMKEQRNIARTIAELEMLDDHALRDIGLSRQEIEARVRGLR